MLRVSFNSKMWIAWGVLAFLAIGYELGRGLMQADAATASIMLSIALFNPLYLVWLIRALHGPKLVPSDEPPFILPTSAWGFIWRCYIVYFVQLGISAMILQALPVGKITEALPWELFFLISSPIATWLLFSRDRKGQLSYILAAFGGY